MEATLPSSPVMRELRDIAGALSYENAELVERYARRHSVPLQDAENLFAETKKFLVVCAASNFGCSPSKKLDEMWHHFILHTRAYAQYCRRFFGFFLHHNPTEKPALESRDEMIALAQELCGSIDPAIWPTEEVIDCDNTCAPTHCDDG